MVKSPGGKHWFKCNKCNHEILAFFFYDSDCGFCTHCLLCEDENCKFCFNNSFASHFLSKYWDKDKNEKSPRSYFLGSASNAYFICEKGHEFEADIHEVTRSSTWCGMCNNTTELNLYLKLKEYFPKIKKGFFPKWCRNPISGHLLPFDVPIEEKKNILELDGCQHFKQVWKWQSPETRQELDIYKMKKAIENGYSVIRITQKYVAGKKFKIKTLLKHIKKYDEPTLIFIGDEYEVMIEKLLKDDIYHLV